MPTPANQEIILQSLATLELEIITTPTDDAQFKAFISTVNRSFRALTITYHPDNQQTEVAKKSGRKQYEALKNAHNILTSFNNHLEFKAAYDQKKTRRSHARSAINPLYAGFSTAGFFSQPRGLKFYESLYDHSASARIAFLRALSSPSGMCSSAPYPLLEIAKTAVINLPFDPNTEKHTQFVSELLDSISGKITEKARISRVETIGPFCAVELSDNPITQKLFFPFGATAAQGSQLGECISHNEALSTFINASELNVDPSEFCRSALFLSPCMLTFGGHFYLIGSAGRINRLVSLSDCDEDTQSRLYQHALQKVLSENSIVDKVKFYSAKTISLVFEPGLVSDMNSDLKSLLTILQKHASHKREITLCSVSIHPESNKNNLVMTCQFIVHNRFFDDTETVSFCINRHNRESNRVIELSKEEAQTRINSLSI